MVPLKDSVTIAHISQLLNLLVIIVHEQNKCYAV